MRLLALLLAVFVATACGPSRAERAAAVIVARDTVADPAARVGTLAEAAAEAVRRVRLEGLRDVADWQANVDAVADGPLRDYAAAVDAVVDLALVAPQDVVARIDEARAAQEQWDLVRAAAIALRDRALHELDDLQRILAWDAQLAELTDAWQEPGSRSTQLSVFAENADLADSLADAIAADVPPTCPEQLQRRVEAASFVAATTRELRDHIAAYRGAVFDQRRLELAEDPTGLGQPFSTLDASDEPCWTASSGVDTAPLFAALEALQSALNPPDLQ